MTQNPSGENASTNESGALRAEFQRYLDIVSRFYGPWRARIAAVGEFGFIAIAFYPFYRLGRLTRRLHPRWLGLILRLVGAAARILPPVTTKPHGTSPVATPPSSPARHSGSVR